MVRKENTLSAARADTLPTNAAVLSSIIDFYTSSPDFNGLPYYLLCNDFQSGTVLTEVLAELISSNQIVGVFGDRHPNAHVLALEPEHPSEQVGKLATSLSDHTCFYPSREALRPAVDISHYSDRPYSLELALGSPVLSPRFFDLHVLENYRNDPRYYYWASDTSGYLSVFDQTKMSSPLKESDQVLLQTFGFGHNEEVSRRVVVVYLSYLHHLSPEHQKIWEARELKGNFLVHPSYSDATAGIWSDEVGIFEAFKMELGYINEMCRKIRRPPIFREDFSDREAPRNLGFLIRPTKKEYYDFVLTLDKCLSDNIDPAFFQDDISSKEEIALGEGRFEVRRKGTIKLLEDWLEAKFIPKDPAPMARVIRDLKAIRKLRQKPAHGLQDNEFDDTLFQDQRDLICRAYGAVRFLRLILMNHPVLKNFEIDDALNEGKIWTF